MWGVGWESRSVLKMVYPFKKRYALGFIASGPLLDHHRPNLDARTVFFKVGAYHIASESEATSVRVGSSPR